MELKVMVVEEAGQVLESHILASLVESVQQIFMIGDPLQLRLNLNNYCKTRSQQLYTCLRNRLIYFSTFELELATDNPVTGQI